MTKNIVSLTGGPIPGQKAPIPDVVEMLEWALQLARDGELNGLAIAYQFHDGTGGQGRTGILSYTLIGRLAAVSDEMVKSLSIPA